MNDPREYALHEAAAKVGASASISAQEDDEGEPLFEPLVDGGRVARIRDPNDPAVMRVKLFATQADALVFAMQRAAIKHPGKAAEIAEALKAWEGR